MVSQVPGRVGSGDVKNDAEKEAHDSHDDADRTPDEAKAEADKAKTAAGGTEPEGTRERGSPDESAPAAETQETRPTTEPAASSGTPDTEVQIRKQAAELADAPDAPSSGPELDAYIFSEYAELSRTISVAVDNFEARMRPDAFALAEGLDQPKLPRGMKASVERVKEAAAELAGRIHTPEEQHKGQEKDRYNREVVE